MNRKPVKRVIRETGPEATVRINDTNREYIRRALGSGRTVNELMRVAR